MLPNIVLPPSPSSISSSHSFTSDSDMQLSHSLSLSDDLDAMSPPPAKKRRVRQNLSHLTMEEKLNRRKMKNRVAAQSARDRRKAKMDLMEQKVAKLSEERIKLIRENERLQKLNQKLNLENQQLRNRVSAFESNATMAVVNASAVKQERSDDASFVSAAHINDPQQQEQGSVTPSATCAAKDSIKADMDQHEIWMLPFVCWLIAIENLMRSSSGSRSVLMNFLKVSDGTTIC